MRLFKRLFPLLLCLCALTMTACGLSKNKYKTLSDGELSALADELANNIKYDFELSSVMTEESFLLYFNEVPDDVKGFLYMSTTSSAEMVAVIQTRSEEDAKAMADQLNAYMDDEYSEFLRYEPKEAEKLKERIVVRYGKCVVASVSPNPNQAHKIINEHFEDN